MKVFKEIDQLIITQVRKQFRMINFINFNPIEQNSQIGFKTNPRIFNCSQNPKLIKLTNKDHVYNSIPTKPNDQFQNKSIESTKIPSLKRSKNSIKMHEIMKIRTKGGV